jgi:hypothetical protein
VLQICQHMQVLGTTALLSLLFMLLGCRQQSAT